MRYIDSSIRSAQETVAFWMHEAVQAGIREFRCQSGYFTLEGMSVLLPALKKCAGESATVKLLIGSNQGVTVASHVAFIAGTLGIPRDNVSIGIVSFEGGLFHPKAYHVVRTDGTQTAYVGSANLTGPAIEGSNIEAGIILDTRALDAPVILEKIANTIDTWFTNQLDGVSIVNQLTDIDALLASGHLSFTLTRQAQGENETTQAREQSRAFRPRLAPVFKLPGVRDENETSRTPATPKSDGPPHFRTTEASYHYPQGTHPGHLLSILYYFSRDRKGTGFDDQYIRLNGSLGEGRLATYRRQIKYKMLAAIELGLITDVRVVENIADYKPELTKKGRRLWSLLEPHLDERDLIIEIADDGELSSRMPKDVSAYISAIRAAQINSDALRV